MCSAFEEGHNSESLLHNIYPHNCKRFSSNISCYTVTTVENIAVCSRIKLF